MQELWARWPGRASLYRVSTYGNVLGLYRNKPLHVSLDRDGYRKVLVTIGGRRCNRRVSRMVLETFVGPARNGTDHADHINADRQDDSLSNLRWVTPKENIKHRDDLDHTSRGEDRPNAKLTASDVLDIVAKVRAGSSQADVARYYGVHKTNISLIMRGRAWRRVTKELI